MKQEEIGGLFIQLCRCHITGAEPVFPDDYGPDDAARLMSLAAIHNLSGIVCAETGMPAGADGDGEVAFLSALGTCASGYVLRRENYDELVCAFKGAGLWLIPVKGILIAEDYPEPALRPMGDIDIIAGKGERRAVEKLLKTLGYEETSRTGGTLSYGNGTCSLDVRFADPGETGITGPEDGFSGELIPDRTEHFAYLVAHLAQHIRETGCGVRQFLDIAVAESSGGIDGERAKEILEKKGLGTFAGVALLVTRDWFGTEPPFEISEDAETRRTAERLAAEALSGGVFGRANSGNRLLFSAKNAAGGAGPVKLFFRRLFPPYSQMRTFGYCGWLDGRPYLLPAAWVARLFRGLFTRSPSESLKTVAEPFAHREEIADRADYLNRLGIPTDREFF